MIKLSELKLLKNNPRSISKRNFEKLKESIKEFPNMLELRPIIIDGENNIIAGNQRTKALLELGYEEIDEKWVKRFDNLTEQEYNEFIVKDNFNYGIFNKGIYDFIDKSKFEGLKIRIQNYDIRDRIEKYNKNVKIKINKALILDLESGLYDKFMNLKQKLKIRSNEKLIEYLIGKENDTE